MADRVNRPIFVIKDKLFEEAFKLFLIELIKNDKITISELNELNKKLSKNLIVGSENVDFNNQTNKKALDGLVNETWEFFLRKFKLLLLKHKRNFVKK